MPPSTKISLAATKLLGGRPAFRLSVSFWRTENADIERLILQLTGLRAERERPLLHSAPK
jgi:hypothetical protein